MCYSVAKVDNSEVGAQYGEVRGGYSAVEAGSIVSEEGYSLLEVDKSEVEVRYSDVTQDTWTTSLQC